MADSPELTAYKTDVSNAGTEFQKDLTAAANKPTQPDRDAAIDEAKRKLDEALKKAKEKYLAAQEAAVKKFKENLNKQIEKLNEKKETNMKTVTDLLPSVTEAGAYSPYRSSNDCKAKGSGDCTRTPNKDNTIFKCEQGNCKCKCHAYISIGGVLLLANDLVHGAGFGFCPNIEGLTGAGSVQCKCVEK